MLTYIVCSANIYGVPTAWHCDSIIPHLESFKLSRYPLETAFPLELKEIVVMVFAGGKELDTKIGITFRKTKSE